MGELYESIKRGMEEAIAHSREATDKSKNRENVV